MDEPKNAPVNPDEQPRQPMFPTATNEVVDQAENIPIPEQAEQAITPEESVEANTEQPVVEQQQPIDGDVSVPAVVEQVESGSALVEPVISGVNSEPESTEESVAQPAAEAPAEAVAVDSSLPPLTEDVAEAPKDDFAPKFEEASGGGSGHQEVSVAVPGAFATNTVADNSPKSKPESPVSANSLKAQKNAPAAHSKKALVFIATIVGLVLAAVVIYIYIASNKSAVSVDNTPDPRESISAEEVSSSIEQTQQEIDSISDTEFGETDLSDSTLGL